jgi:hypothetical protein
MLAHFLLSTVLGLVGHNSLRSNGGNGGLHSAATSFVKALEFKRRLRVCNAYPYPTALDIYRGSEQMTEEEPMSYKSCRDFSTELTAGEKLIFKVGNANAGTFSVSDLPNNDAVLLLIVYRHDTLSTAVSFESHVYANLLNAQVAVVDAYKGPEKAALKIEDHTDAKTSRSEELRFDSVVAVNPGKYDVVLLGTEGETVATSSLVALNRESYIIMRTGVKAQQGSSYSQELVVYPQSDASLLGAAPVRGLALALLAMFALGC